MKKYVSVRELLKEFQSLKNLFSSHLRELENLLEKSKQAKSTVSYAKKNQISNFFKQLKTEHFQLIDSLQFEELKNRYEQHKKKKENYVDRIEQIKQQKNLINQEIIKLNPSYIELKQNIDHKFDFLDYYSREFLNDLLNKPNYIEEFQFAYNSSFFKRLFNSYIRDVYSLLQSIENKTYQQPIEYILSFEQDLDKFNVVKNEFESLSKKISEFDYSKDELTNEYNKFISYGGFQDYLQKNFDISYFSDEEKSSLFNQIDCDYYPNHFFDNKIKVIDIFIDKLENKLKIIQKQYQFVSKFYSKLDNLNYRKLDNKVNFDMNSIQRLKELSNAFELDNNKYKESLARLNSSDFRAYEHQNRNNNDFFNLMLIYLAFSSDVSANDNMQDNLNCEQNIQQDSMNETFNFDDFESSFNDISRDFDSLSKDIDSFAAETRNSYSNNDFNTNNIDVGYSGSGGGGDSAACGGD